MCIICECNTKLTKDEFHECFISNSHGAGFAWHADGMNHYIKGFMTEATAWEAYQSVPVPHVAHFRLASAGGIHPDLTHPFIVSEDSPIQLTWDGAESLVFHNGTILDWKEMLFAVCMRMGYMPAGEMSDTRFVAMAMSVLGGDAMRFFSSSKFAVMDEDGVITRYGVWEKDGSNWYSNSGYKTRSYVYTRSDWAGMGYDGTEAAYYGSAGRSYWPSTDSIIPYADRDCLNCKFYLTDLKCKKKGEMHNTNKCGDWAEKRGRGRPKSIETIAKERAKERAKELESKRTLPAQLAGTGGQTSLALTSSSLKGRTCLTCDLYEGDMHCKKRPEKMVNINPCAMFKEKVGAAMYKNYGI